VISRWQIISESKPLLLFYIISGNVWHIDNFNVIHFIIQ